MGIASWDFKLPESAIEETVGEIRRSYEMGCYIYGSEYAVGFFRAENIASAILFIKEMCCLSSFTVREELYSCFRLTEFTVIEEEIGLLNYLPTRIVGFHLWMFILGAFFIILNFRNSREINFKPTVAKSLLTVIFMLWSVISLSGISIFLYFDF